MRFGKGTIHRLRMKQSILDKLEQRLGRLHARQRLGIERDHEDSMATRSSILANVVYLRALGR
jgi:hypothetical protein